MRSTLISVISLTLAACGQLGVGTIGDPGPSLATIHITPGNGTVPRGGHLQFEAIGVFSDGSSRSVTNEVAWSTGDSHVASVSNEGGYRGLVRGEREGVTEVHALLQGASAKAIVTVQPAVVLSLSLAPDGASSPVGIALQLKAMATLSDTTTEDVTASATFTPGDGLILGNTPGAIIGTRTGTFQVSASVGAVGAQASVVITGATLTQVILSPDPLSVPLGASTMVQLWGEFSDGSKSDLTAQAQFSSSAPAVAQFSSASPGQLTGMSQGSAMLSGSFGGFTSQSLVAVTQAALVAVEISPNPVALAHDTEAKLKATARFSDGSSLDVTGQAVWNASPSTIASVNQAGVLSAHAAGSGTVGVTYGGLDGSAPVTVSPANLLSVDVSPASSTIPAGTTVKLAATGHFDDGTMQEVTFFALWSSQDAQVASVAFDAAGEAVVTGHTVGSVQVSATVLGQTGASQVTVSAAVLTSLEVDPATASVPLGASAPLKAVGVYSDGSAADVTAQALWASSSPSVTVSNASGTEGLVSAVSLGSATVSATFQGMSASSAVSAVPAQLLSISITASGFSSPLGVPVQLTAMGVYTDGSRDITTQVGWTSSDLTVATVSNAAGTHGKVTPVSVGAAQISAVLGTVSTMQTFTVTAAQLVSVLMTPSAVSMPKGLPVQLTLVGSYTDGSQQDLSSLASWTSSDNTVAAAGPGGMVATLGTGMATITAQVPGFSGAAAVTVTPAQLTNLLVNPSSVAAPAGATRPLAATGLFTDGSSQPMTTQVTWASDNGAVVVVSNALGSQGLLTTLAVGSANVTARFGTVVSMPVPVTVSTVKLVSIEVLPANSSTALGFSRQMFAMGHYNNGSSQPLSSVVWSSSDGSVATVSPTGLLSTVAQGTVTVSAGVGGLSGSTQHTVTAPVQVGVTIQGSAGLSVGSSTQLKAVAELSDGTVNDVTAMATWSSSDPSVSVGSTGLATGVSAGTSTVSASYSGDLGTVDITVTP